MNMSFMVTKENMVMMSVISYKTGVLVTRRRAGGYHRFFQVFKGLHLLLNDCFPLNVRGI